MNPPSITTVGAERVTLPTSCWKVWLEIPARSRDADDAVGGDGDAAPLRRDVAALDHRLTAEVEAAHVERDAPGRRRISRRRRARAAGEDAGWARLAAAPEIRAGPVTVTVTLPPGRALPALRLPMVPPPIRFKDPAVTETSPTRPSPDVCEKTVPPSPSVRVRAESESAPPSPAKFVLLPTRLGFRDESRPEMVIVSAEIPTLPPGPVETRFTLARKPPAASVTVPPVAVTVRLPPPCPATHCRRGGSACSRRRRRRSRWTP